MISNANSASSVHATPSIPTDASPTATFTLFPELPEEIQLQIWACALPSPRHLDGAMPLIIGRNLSDIRAILPSIEDFTHAFNPFDEDLGSSMPPEYAPDMLGATRQPILAMMWACKQSREVARSTYRLGFESLVTHEQQSWWEKDQRVFFPPVPRKSFYRFRHQAQYQWLFKAQQHCFSDLKHITLYLNAHFRSLVDPTPHVSRERYFNRMVREGLGVLGLPNLQSLTLLLDPADVGWTEKGRILYYEPEEVPLKVFPYSNIKPKPREISTHVQRILAGEVSGKERETPEVNIFVMVWESGKGTAL